MNNSNLSDAKLNALLGMAGKKLGQDPESLKQQLQEGNLDSIMSKMDPKAKEQVSSFLNDRKKVEALMADEKVRNLLSGILGNKQ